MITQAVITAGGRGERLRPLTDTIPKVMIPLGQRPLLEYHIEQFKKYGVREFFFTLQYMPEKITGYFGDGSRWGVKIFYHIEKKPLGDMGGIKAFEDNLHDEFFFTWGDMYSEMDYSRLEDHFFGRVRKLFSEGKISDFERGKEELRRNSGAISRSSDNAAAESRDFRAGRGGSERALTHPGAIGVERVAQVPYKSEADFVGLDEKKKLIAVYPKGGTAPTGPVYRLRGSAVFGKRILKYFPPAAPFNKKDLLVGLINVGEEFYGYECDEYSKGIDTMEKYNEVQRHILP